MEIKLRYQLSKNFQIVDVEGKFPSEKINIFAPQLLEIAKNELNKISDINPGKIKSKITSTYKKKSSQKINANNSNEIAINSKGYPATTIDRVELTNDEVAKAKRNTIQYWKVTKNDIDRLS